MSLFYLAFIYVTRPYLAYNVTQFFKETKYLQVDLENLYFFVINALDKKEV